MKRSRIISVLTLSILSLSLTGCFGRVPLGSSQVVYKATVDGLDSAKLRGPGEFSMTGPFEKSLEFPTKNVFFTFTEDPNVGNRTNDAIPIRIEGSVATMNMTVSLKTNIDTNQNLSHPSNEALRNFIRQYGGMSAEQFLRSDQFRTIVISQASEALRETGLSQQKVVTDSAATDQFFLVLSQKVDEALPAFEVVITPYASLSVVSINLDDAVEARYRQAAENNAALALAEQERLAVEAANRVEAERARGEVIKLKTIQDAGLLPAYIELQRIDAMKSTSGTVVFSNGSTPVMVAPSVP